MRWIGLPELLVILGLLVLFLAGRRLPELLPWLGNQLRGLFDRIRWLYQALGGTEEEEQAAESAVGERLAERFLAHAPPTPNPELQGRVRRVGERLAAKSSKRRFIVQVVEAAEANAYALPGGYIFLSRQLLEQLQPSDDELAFLIAHEMAHIVHKHPAEQALVDALLHSVRPGHVLAELLAKGYSREQELEADATGAEFMKAAGFRPEAAIRVLERLHARPQPGLLKTYLSTHPPVEERCQHLSTRLGTQRTNG